VLPRRAVCFLPLLLAVACRNPGYLPVPPQRAASQGRDPGELWDFVRMDDRFADAHFVRDVSPGQSHLRWTFARPELKLRIQSASHRRFVMEFEVPEVTFHDTGPVVVSCFVNGRSLGSMRCPRAGPYRFERPVPEGWLQPGDVTVRAEVDKHWVAKEDGAQLGLLLRAIGFSEQK
jgi:hypothetical protein